MPTVQPITTSLYVPQRIHIVPTGFEVDRVVLPAVELRAELVILLSNPPSVDKAGLFRDQVKRALARRGIRCEETRSPIFDLGRTLDVLVRLLRQHRKDHLSINISAGSKIQALAGSLAAMLARGEGIEVTVYYAEPRRYRENPPRTPLSFGLAQIVELAPLTLPSPAEEVKVGMRLLAARPYSKLELALQLVRMGQLPLNKVTKAGAPVDERARVSLQSAVDQKVVQPLLRAGYATAQRRGRKVIVSLTETGFRASALLTAGVEMDAPAHR